MQGTMPNSSSTTSAFIRKLISIVKGSVSRTLNRRTTVNIEKKYNRKAKPCCISYRQYFTRDVLFCYWLSSACSSSVGRLVNSSYRKVKGRQPSWLVLVGICEGEGGTFNPVMYAGRGNERTAESLASKVVQNWKHTFPH
jgi:hypothetical protein